MTTPRCDNCRHSFIVRQGMAHGLQCRRNPPSVIAIQTPQGINLQSVQPMVGADEACGEFVVKGVEIAKSIPALAIVK